MKTLLIVYNADSGHFNAVIDTVHKMVAPESYSCSLCAITHGPLSMKRAWRDFLSELDMDVEFFHRDEYDGVTPGTTLPMILVRDESGSTSTLLSADDIGRLRTVDELISEVNRRLVIERNTP